MPQQDYSGFTPDPEPDYSGFTPDEPEPIAAPESKGLLQRWDENIINQPLSHKLTGGPVGPRLSEYIDPSSAKPDEQWRIPSWVPMIGGGTWRSLDAGAAEGLANVAESFTSPLNLATMGTAGVYSRAAKTATTLPSLAASAYTTAPKVANVARRATQALSAPMAATGVARIGEGLRTGDYGKAALGVPEIAGAILGVRMPKVGGRPGMPDELPLPAKKLPKVDDEGNLAVSELMTVRKAQQRAREGLPPEEIQPQAAAPITPEATELYRGEHPDNQWIRDIGSDESGRWFTSDKDRANKIYAGDSSDAGNLFSTKVPTSDLEGYRNEGGLANEYLLPDDIATAAGAGNKTRPAKSEASPAPFNPATLEFVDRNTGEIKPAGKAQPGDVPLVPDDTAPVATDNIDTDTPVPSTRRAGKLAQFTKNLIKSESGEYNPNWAEEFRAGRENPEVDTPETPRRVDPETIPEHTRTYLNRLSYRDIQDAIVQMARGEQTPLMVSVQQYAHDILDGRNSGTIAETETMPSRVAIRRQEVEREQATQQAEAPVIREGEDLAQYRPSRDIRYDDDTGNFFDRNTRNWDDISDATPEESIRARGINTGEILDPTMNRTTDNALRQDVTNLGLDDIDPRQLASAIDHFRDIGRTDIVNYLTERTEPTGRRVDPALLRRVNRESIDGMSNESLRDFIRQNESVTSETNVSGQNNLSYARDVLEGRGVGTHPPPFRPKGVGLSLDELESTKKTSGMERLGKLIGADRAAKLKSGEVKIDFDEKPHRFTKAKHLDKHIVKGWSDWGDNLVTGQGNDKSKIGMHFTEPSKFAPEQFEAVFRDKNGVPQGIIRTDRQGKGISEFAVNSKLGLGRGKIAIRLMKEAMDRGITEPSGSTSDLTKNLIDRIKRLVRNDKGEYTLDGKSAEAIEAIATKINKLIDDIAGSKAGKAFGRFLKDETGEGDIGPSKLPKELRGAKPRFNVGADTYMPNFADDLDKALYIISQNIKSKADAQYMKFVVDQTGLGEVAARNLGQKVRGVIKKAVVGKETGKIDIPPVARAKQLEANAAKRTSAPPEPAKPALGPKEYIAGKPQVDTGPLVPENVKPAPPEALASLASRLKKAVETKDTPNAVAPEDIAKLIDEATQVMNNLPEGPEKAGVIRQVLAANKAILTSWDMSAPGRQGKAFIFNKSYWNAVIPMMKAWKSKGAADLINQSIVEHPSGYFEKPIGATGKQGKSFAEKMGLDLASTEEAFSGVIDRAAAKIPGVARSGRAHTAFLNKLRSDQFVSMMDKSKKAGRNPESDIALAKTYAKFINDATGRGSVNIGRWKLERNLGALNDVFFAPKNMSGQIRTWNAMLNPQKYWMADNTVRLQALRSLFAVAGLGVGIGQIASLAGAKVSNDPTSSDFQKIKVGDTRIDLFGGYQQFPVAAMKFFLNQSTPTTGKNAGETQDLSKGRMGQNRASLVERYFTNRLSPVGSFIWAWMSGREFDGKPFEVKKALYERTLPIATKDILELAQEDPALALILGPATLTGLVGTQTYSGR